MSCPLGCSKSKQPDPKTASDGLSTEELRVAELIESEDVILDLTPRLAQFAKWFQSESESSGKILDDLLTCQTLGLSKIDTTSDSTFSTNPSTPAFIQSVNWPIADSPSSNAVNPWQPVLDLGVVWETLKFGVVSGDFLDESRSEITLHTKCEARGTGSNQSVFGLKAKQDLVFSKRGDEWELSKWEQKTFIVKRTDQPLFEEMLATVLSDSESLAIAQRSFKDELIVQSSRHGEKLKVPAPKLSKWAVLASSHNFPAVSVVDFNNDGREDLFLTSRWGPTQMLECQEDGTYKNVAKEIGLYEEYMVNCALFVDIDNDGDQDAILGRSMETAKFLLNENGTYQDVTTTNSDLGKQYFISGISACDVNRDGLVDIYLSNYPPLSQLPFEDEFLEWQEIKKFDEKIADTENRWTDLKGSANVLLMNRGDGQLERVPFDDALSQWRHSYQSAWADIDNDGDDDLYICNDFAPDALLRNDTPQGSKDPQFTDITNESLSGKGIGFGMGISFGDFDQDGDFDAYVSNMFSKAGRRISQKLGSVDPRIAISATGSYLYVNEAGTLVQRAGSEEGQFNVNQVGWAYGGQFADFDNNGQLDIYVPTGYYTAPDEIATEVDT